MHAGKTALGPFERLSLRQRIFLFFAALAVGSLLALGFGLLIGYRRLAGPESLSAFVQGGIAAGFIILALVAWIWVLFDTHVARAIESRAAAIRARAHADVTDDLDDGQARYLGDLGPAAAAVSRRLNECRDVLGQTVEQETARIAGEKALLETLLADVPAGVLLCTGDHRIVFYNGPAADVLGAGQAPGLARNLFDYLRDGPVRDAYQRLYAAGDADAVSDLMCATNRGARVLSARMRILRDGEQGPDPGYVLTLRDITADHGGDVGSNAALARVRSADLLDALRGRVEGIGLPVEIAGPDLIMRVDGYGIVALVAGLAQKIAGQGSVSALRVEIIEEDGPGGALDLSWVGPSPAAQTLDVWLAEPVDPAAPELTGHAVLATHGTSALLTRLDAERAMIRIAIREARRAVPRPTPITRTVVYDFALLSRSRSGNVADQRLEDISFVVFDTETTGLDPERDEVVQIAAVRVVNGRLVEREVFDTLVDPGRSIPAGASAVHGITDQMVIGAPDMGEAGARFHRFAGDAVLVAHNAPFDMAFLRRHEASIGMRFDNPIFDTVLLSAVLFGQQESHSLDSLAARLGVTIPEAERHTAIGDARATARTLVKMLPMLSGRGLTTFASVLAEMRRHGRLLKDLN